MTHLEWTHDDKTGITTVISTCPSCNKATELQVPTEGFCRWLLGEEYIQVAMPGLSADEREMLMSGICPVCWDVLFCDE